MDGKTYKKLASRTINKKLDPEDILHHGVFGLCSEAGEVAGIMQKEYQGHISTMEHLKKELGDIMWFIAEICFVEDIDLDEVMELNIEKLKKRYPDGFEEERSLNRIEGDI